MPPPGSRHRNQRERKDGTGGGEILWPDGTWAPWFIKGFDVVEITEEEARARFGSLDGPPTPDARSLEEQLKNMKAEENPA